VIDSFSSSVAYPVIMIIIADYANFMDSLTVFLALLILIIFFLSSVSSTVTVVPEAFSFALAVHPCIRGHIVNVC